mmetsp:Transcript_17744/g.24764  ORF Transcript_17744/g.24764 Transcript_17744/m.24764 type:complete len:96 (+) Transcript_17744:948-1235(+)
MPLLLLHVRLPRSYLRHVRYRQGRCGRVPLQTKARGGFIRLEVSRAQYNGSNKAGDGMMPIINIVKRGGKMLPPCDISSQSSRENKSSSSSAMSE